MLRLLSWEAKLDQATELSHVALMLADVHTTEAAVERTFSGQKHLITPLQIRLDNSTAQANMFVKYNFVQYGPRRLLPPALQQPAPVHHYIRDTGEAADESALPGDTEVAADLPDNLTDVDGKANLLHTSERGGSKGALLRSFLLAHFYRFVPM